MSTVTENDLREVKELISELAKTQKEEFSLLNEKINDMRVNIATLTEGQNNLYKRIDSVDNRLNTVTLGVFGLIGVLVTALITFVGKFVFFPNL
jgi:predicted nuclease with TOPRIM domain